MAQRIAIVGAGFSGTLVAMHLLREEAEPGTEVLLFERARRFARGVAYGTLRGFHLLNMPVARMSAFEEQPDDFLGFLRQRDPDTRPGDFVPRSLYGEYLARRLSQAEGRGAECGVALTRVAAHVVDLTRTREGFRLLTEEGCPFDVTHVVLALGNFAPPPLVARELQGPWYVGDPWAEGALENLPAGPVILVGTGLTMFDVALAVAEVQPAARLLALSRRGLVAQAHRVHTEPPPARGRPRGIEAWPRTALGLLRAVRAEVAAATSRGIDWRAVVTSLRVDTAELWQSLPPAEKRRFLRHVRPFWEIHRHRAAPATGEAVQELVRRGRLVLRAGQVVEYRPAADGASVEARVRLRGAHAPEPVRAVRVINCTGPQTDLERVPEPLVRALRLARAIRADELGLGLDAEVDGAVFDSAGIPDPRLFAVGPLCKSRAWEATAVPELRTATAAVARAVARAGSPALGASRSYG